jgi:DNA primase
LSLDARTRRADPAHCGHYALLTAAAEVYHTAIFNQPMMLEYLADRKIELDTVRRHRIGYVAGNELAKYPASEAGIHRSQDLGLLGPPGETTREFFRQRIVIQKFVTIGSSTWSGARREISEANI